MSETGNTKLPNGRFESIDELYAFVSVDEEGEGIAGFLAPDGVMMPMVGADTARVESLIPMARKMAKASGKSIEIRKYSHRTLVQVIEP